MQIIGFFAILFILAAIAIGTATVWITIVVIRSIFRGLGLLGRRPDLRVTVATLCCPRRDCQALNPTTANFCRRCGQRIGRRQVFRQAAMW